MKDRTMTENEAIEELQTAIELAKMCTQNLERKREIQGYEMAIKPILFNTEMVRAILDGRKSCTRRLIKHNVDAILNSPYHKEHPEVEDKQIISKLCQPPYQPGDILYVRETWGYPIDLNSDEQYVFRADEVAESGFKNDSNIWHPSIHMPKEAARIWLKVTDVRVERLQEITEEEAKAEGINEEWARSWWHPTYDDPDSGGYPRYRDTFALDLWNSTIKKSALDKYGWDANPWVWVVEFERCEKPEGV